MRVKRESKRKRIRSVRKAQKINAKNLRLTGGNLGL